MPLIVKIPEAKVPLIPAGKLPAVIDADVTPLPTLYVIFAIGMFAHTA